MGSPPCLERSDIEVKMLVRIVLVAALPRLAQCVETIRELCRDHKIASPTIEVRTVAGSPLNTVVTLGGTVSARDMERATKCVSKFLEALGKYDDVAVYHGLVVRGQVVEFVFGPRADKELRKLKVFS
jgi:hypothetical protein